jgi:hypothetical protein
MKQNSTLKRWTTAAAMLALLVVQLSPAAPVVLAQSGLPHHAMQASGHDAGSCDTAPTQCSGGLLCDHGCAACWHGFSASLTTAHLAAAVPSAPRFLVPVTYYQSLPLDLPARPPQALLS